MMNATLLSRRLAALFLAASTSSWAQGLPATVPTQPAQASPTAPQVTLNFVNADLESAVRAVAQATDRNILVDPRVKGVVNLVTEKPVTRQQALETLGSVLRMQGYALVEGNGFMKVVPEADAKLQGAAGIVTAVGASPASKGDQIMTQVFRLNYESANNLLPVLRPLIAPNNTITAYPGNNTLVVTDYAENLRRIERIIAAIDAPAGSDTATVTLQYAIASDIAALLNRLLDPGATGASDASLRTTVLAEPRTNSLLIRANSAARIQQAKSLIAKLDLPTARPGNIWVVPLRNAEAAKLAQTLRAIVAADGSLSSAGNTANTTSNGASATPVSSPGFGSSTGSFSNSSLSSNTTNLGSGATASFAASNVPTTGGIIQADTSTNALIITASEPVYRNLRDVIDRLDTRRAQIYVESLIVEVSLEKAAEFGIQWQGILGGGDSRFLAGTNFGTGGSNIVNLGTNINSLLNLGNGSTSSTVAPAGGLNLGYAHRFGNVFGLAALARALEAQGGVNVLSTPNLMTLDNEEARIVIGQNVPFITGQYAQTGSSSTVTPFQTVERKDVGITLRVRPQISDGGLVKLQIYQEASSIASTTNSAGIITNQRAIESSVLVEDGQIIALGGLMEDNFSDGAQKVPFLGDLPGVGALFRYENKQRKKTNLMVFLRPYVIRSSAQSDAVVTDRYDYMRNAAENIEPNSRFLPGPDKPDALPSLDTPHAPLIDLRKVRQQSQQAVPASATSGETTTGN